MLRHLYLDLLRACYLFDGCGSKFLDAVLAICKVRLRLRLDFCLALHHPTFDAPSSNTTSSLRRTHGGISQVMSSNSHLAALNCRRRLMILC